MKFYMKKLVNAKGGEIYAIPLFLSDIPENKSFAKDKFLEKGKEFSFCRIIEDLIGGGILIEVFDLIGNLDQDMTTIIHANRLFSPVAVSGLGIYKKRWKKIYEQNDYDKFKDSNFSEIKLIAGMAGNFKLWQGGKKTPISDEEAKKYEIWKIWRESQLEKRIIKELFDK